MKLLHLIIVFVLSSLTLFGQQSIQSSVFDSKNGLPLEMATIRLLNQTDSAMVQGVVTNEKGGFMLTKIKPGNYILAISVIGYTSQFKNIAVAKKDLILRSIQLMENAKLLGEVEVKGTAAQLVVKGDTLEYNATAFKTPENSPLEELLKKLPGVEISPEGKITVNGEEIKKIRLDGKKFFSGDIEQATKNLPADMIEKIQVLEQKSDMAMLTGFEDGETERIINLTTKANRRNGMYGNATAGGGIDINKELRYDGGVSLNLMKGDAQTSINASGNNLNTSRSSRSRGPSGGGSSGGSSGGITSSENFGLNNNTILNPNFKIGGDITMNHSSNFSDTESNKISYLSEINYTDLSKNTSESDRYDANVRLEAEWKIDSLRTLIIQPSFNFNNSDSYNIRDYSLLTEMDSTSWGNSYNRTLSNGISGGINFIYNRKFSSKKGRSLTTSFEADFSQSESESQNISDKFTKTRIVNINQKNFNESDRFGNRLKISYVEPLWNIKNMLEVAMSVRTTSTTSEKKQYSKDADNNYTVFNPNYSNDFKNRFFRESLELNYRYTEKDYNLMFGLNAEPSQTNNIRTYGNGLIKDTTYAVFNFAPTARLQYNFAKKKFARLDYRGRTEQPSIQDMQPVKNNNNLTAETVGNPLLNPSFIHYMRFMYSAFNDKSFSSFNTFFVLQAEEDALISNKIYDNTLKVYNQTINAVNTPINLNWNLMFNTPLIKKRLHFNTATMLGYRTQYSNTKRNVSILDIDIENLALGDLSKTRTYNASEEIALTFTHDVVEFGLRGRLGYSNSLNNLKNVKTEVWNWTGRANVVIRLPYDFSLGSDIAYSDRAGYTNMDQSEIMWNASIDKNMFKNKATLSLKATDILQQRLNIRQTVGDNFIQYNSYNTLASYFILSFTYKINSFGGKKDGFKRPDGFVRPEGMERPEGMGRPDGSRGPGSSSGGGYERRF